ncbi:alpha-tectorin-like [Ciona intestinalis]
MDNDGSFSCMCNSGYQMNAQGSACQDILECNNTSTCNTTTSQCSETPGSYQCSCKTGYQKPSGSSPQSDTCMNINECNNTLACRNANCTDLPGTFRCDCWYSYIRLTAQSCIPRNITRCVNVTCEVGQECQEDEFGHGTCQCQTTHHRHNDTCLPRFQLVQRTSETFQAAFNNLTSPEALQLIGRFKMTMLPLAGVIDIVALIVTNLQPGSVIVTFDILVGPASATTSQQEILTTIIQSINSNTFNTSFLLGLPRGGEVNITGVCPPLVDRSTIDETTLQNNKLNANMTCQSSLVGISIDVCNLTNIGILPTELVVAAHGANLSAVATQCKPTILRTVDGKLSATFLISNIFDCGAIAAMDAQTLTLSYNLQTVPPTAPSSSQIQRYYDTSVIFNCSFARSEVVNSPLLMPQLQRIQLAQPAVSGKFDISLMLCQDQNCATSLQGNPPVVRVTDYVYFKAALSASDFTVLQARECWATPTSNSSNPTRYPIIESGCPSNADPTSITVVKNYNTSYITAGFKSFAWVGINDQKIFIHCQLDVCVNSAANCSGPVCSPGKKKRSVQNYHEGKLYSFGPLKLVTPCDEPGTCDHQCTLHNGEPICSCYAGFTLDSDGKTCVKITPEEKQTSWMSMIIVIVVFITALYLGLNSMFTKPKKSSKVLTT